MIVIGDEAENCDAGMRQLTEFDGVRAVVVKGYSSADCAYQAGVDRSLRCGRAPYRRCIPCGSCTLSSFSISEVVRALLAALNYQLWQFLPPAPLRHTERYSFWLQ